MACTVRWADVVGNWAGVAGDAGGRSGFRRHGPLSVVAVDESRRTTIPTQADKGDVTCRSTTNLGRDDGQRCRA